MWFGGKADGREHDDRDVEQCRKRAADDPAYAADETASTGVQHAGSGMIEAIRDAQGSLRTARATASVAAGKVARSCAVCPASKISHAHSTPTVAPAMLPMATISATAVGRCSRDDKSPSRHAAE